MKARLVKLLAVVVPALVSLAIAPGSASAWSIQPYCTGGFSVIPTGTSWSYMYYDANRDGWICTKVNKNGVAAYNDDQFYFVW